MGKRDEYHWLSTSEHDIDDLWSACPPIVLDKYVAVTAFDSGPLFVNDRMRSSGWQHSAGITYSPRIESLDMAPTDEHYFECYVFGTLSDLEHSLSSGRVEVYANFGGFWLDAPEQDLVSRFWQQLEWIQPEA
jgi:hypothetical protein